MAPKLPFFGTVFLLKHNPWFSGDLAQAVAEGLAKPKKEWILARPPPWMGDPSKLSDAQLAQVLRFSKVASEIKGKGTGKQRIANIKSKASGPTGYPTKGRVRVSKLGRIVTIARARGIAIPPEITIPTIPAPTAPATPVIRE
jgi:hypothetical protein